MTNLTYSLDLVKCVTETEAAFDRSIYFLNGDNKNRKAYMEPVRMIQEIDRLMLLLKSDSELSLCDSDTTVNFYALTDAIKSGQILTAYRSVKVIKSEMLIETNADNLEEFKSLAEFWELMELALGQLLR